jgi:hypothetical protein
VIARILLIIACFVVGAPSDLPRYETRYYIIQTDLDPDGVLEAQVRVTKMAEVYADRCKGFSGVISHKFPFVLFKNVDDYYAAGGVEGSAGLFDGQKLMAVAGEKLSSRTWHVVQHEGFHQFAHAVIGGDIPTWADEGLAEYFGEGIFTGDDFLTGVIPEWRRKRIVKSMQANSFKPIDDMMRLSLNEWNGELSVYNYDQAWSMVQFLAHGEGGKYQPAFIAYMNAIGNGQNSTTAWKDAFGAGPGFEERWREFWLKLPENSTENLYRKATVSTLTSFLARAFAQKQDFQTMEEFATAASEGLLKISQQDFLPKTLLASAMKDVGDRLKAGEIFSIERSNETRAQPKIVLRTANGVRLVGTFQLRNGAVTKINVQERK